MVGLCARRAHLASRGVPLESRESNSAERNRYGNGGPSAPAASQRKALARLPSPTCSGSFFGRAKEREKELK